MKEEILHKQVVNYLKLQYKGVIFHSDFAAGLRMSIYQAKKNKSLQSESKWPDLFIAKPMNNFCGIFIEIKTSIDKVYKKDMTFRKNEHIEAQAALLNRLEDNGYKAVFGCGFEHCKRIIDDYMRMQQPLKPQQ